MSRAISFPVQLKVQGNCFLTLIPFFSYVHLIKRPIDKNTQYILSRFAFLRREGNRILLESPLAPARVVLHTSASAACISELFNPCKVGELARRTGLQLHVARRVLQLLQSAGALTEVDGKGILEDRDALLVSWEFHDLLFHSRSRTGRHGSPYGKKQRSGLEAIPAAVKQYRRKAIRLFKPDLEILVQSDLPFTRVMEERKSKREQGSRPISMRELGEFLFRSARVREFRKSNDFEFTNRVYPSTGASYELEVYLIIDRCKGLRRGLYYYDPARHRLFALEASVTILRQLQASAAATARAGIPQVLIVIGARFQRVSLRYASMSYAGILKDVGVLYQTFYLVATAMNLSGCALGVGNSDLFATAAGLDYYAETSVGEFMLGSTK